MNYSHPQLDRFNYWACTVIALFLFVFILSPLNTLGNVSFALVLIGFINVLIQPKILKYLFQKEAIWLTIIIVVFSMYALILDGWIRSDMSSIRFRNCVGFLVGLTGFAVFQKYGWQSSWLLPAMIVGVWIGGYYSIESIMSGGARFKPNSFNSIYWGAIAAIQMGALTVYAFDLIKKRKYLWLFIVILTLLVAFLSLVASGSRGPLLAILLSIPVVLIFVSNDKKKSIKLGLSSFVTMCLMLVAYVSFYPNHGFSQRITVAINEVAEFYQGELLPTSSGIRLQLWHISQQAVLDSPVIGLSRTGLNDLRNVMIDQGRVHPIVNNFMHMHSDVFHTLATLGVVGFIIYLSFLLILVKYSIQQRSIAASLLFAFVMIFFTSGLTEAYLDSGLGAMLLFTFSIFLKTSIRPEEPRQLYDAVKT